MLRLKKRFQNAMKTRKRQARVERLSRNVQTAFDVLQVISITIGIINSAREMARTEALPQIDVSKMFDKHLDMCRNMAGECTDQIKEVSSCAIRNMRGLARECAGKCDDVSERRDEAETIRNQSSE